jgi:NAD(P)-dependent dehydrogenase (short-subunit alcohol dehydrogenase family)
VFALRKEFDIVVTNAGGPPPGDFREWDREAWIKAVDANMLTPIELIKSQVDGMAARGFGRIVNITSSSVKAPIDILGLSNGARSGLTGFVAGVARTRKLASANVTINNLLPGVFDTDRIKATMEGAAKKTGKTPEEVMAARLATIPANRLGTPAEFGAGLRVPVQRAGQLHHRPERPDRRRRLPRHTDPGARGRSGLARRDHDPRRRSGRTRCAWYACGSSPRKAAEITRRTAA